MRRSDRRKLACFALILLALLPAQLAIETAIAYFVLPRQESAIVTSADGQFQIAHVDMVPPSIPLSTLTLHLLHITAYSFIAGLVLFVVIGVRFPGAAYSLAMHVARWILLPVAVLITTLSVVLLFMHIERTIVSICAQHYDLDVDICPAPWAGAVSSGLGCFGSASAAAFGVFAAYAAAPAARITTARVTAAVLACLALWLFFVHWSWQLLFAVGAVIAATLCLSHHEATNKKAA